MLRPDASAARLTHHASGARDVAAVLQFAPVAARQAASMGAHREAASHYELALRYAGELPGDQRALLQEQLAYEYYLTDQVESAIEARRLALETWRASGRRVKEGDAQRWLSRLSWFAGRRAEAERYAAESITTLEAMPPGPELAMAYSNRAQLYMLADECDRAIEWAQRTIALAQPWGNEEILSHALNNLGTARLHADDESGWTDLERSLQIALANGLHEHAARAYTNLAATAVSRRVYDRATAYLERGLAYCEERDLDSWRLYMLAWRARARFEQGEWQAASDDAEEVLRRSHTAPISRTPALTVLGHLRVRRGDPDASSLLEEVRTLVGEIQEPQRTGPFVAALADAAWLSGDRATIARETQPAYALVRHGPNPWAKGALAVWLWRAGAADEEPNDIAEPYALEIAGEWRAAADAWKALGCPYEFAFVLATYGSEAERREALTIFEQLGAAPAAQNLRRELRAQGVRGIPRGSRPTTRRNPHGLTKREAEILQLLSEGLRNSAIARRLFLSTKTVDHHVSAILTKLGVLSRGEAVAMLRKGRAEPVTAAERNGQTE
jgi:DNA-binding CsgD family transcriptional regulator